MNRLNPSYTDGILNFSPSLSLIPFKSNHHTGLLSISCSAMTSHTHGKGVLPGSYRFPPSPPPLVVGILNAETADPADLFLETIRLLPPHSADRLGDLITSENRIRAKLKIKKSNVFKFLKKYIMFWLDIGDAFRILCECFIFLFVLWMAVYKVPRSNPPLSPIASTWPIFGNSISLRDFECEVPSFYLKPQTSRCRVNKLRLRFMNIFWTRIIYENNLFLRSNPSLKFWKYLVFLYLFCWKVI